MDADAIKNLRKARLWDLIKEMYKHMNMDIRWDKMISLYTQTVLLLDIPVFIKHNLQQWSKLKFKTEPILSFFH